MSAGDRLRLDALGGDSLALHAPWGDRLAPLSGDEDHHLRLAKPGLSPARLLAADLSGEGLPLQAPWGDRLFLGDCGRALADPLLGDHPLLDELWDDELLLLLLEELLDDEPLLEDDELPLDVLLLLEEEDELREDRLPLLSGVRGFSLRSGESSLSAALGSTPSPAEATLDSSSIGFHENSRREPDPPQAGSQGPATSEGNLHSGGARR
ncbi:hypothetical protein NDU88_000106 [Pleurodeles waltl]|uniref:Uncharacterized protein n=1 Tax=Pleurodeles waltl TaxID=8319 RepID=A0AAV7KP16_PLEWA|nr:hypothetical protein NDU88_000106 [Pleurodeles waltl]